MECLITGGAGFIGSHLAEQLVRHGYGVTVIDDLSTGSLRNITHLRHHPRFRCKIGSILDEPVLAELVDRADVIVHLAAAVGVRLIVENPVRTILTNVNGTELVLQCASQGKKPVLLASTSEVYGKSTRFPFVEDQDLVLGPSVKSRWGYACSKALDEFLALAYWREHGLPVTIVRLFNTVGPRQTGRYGMVVPSFVRQAIAGEPITVFGTGGQSRCFVHVRDVVWALRRLLNHRDGFGEVFNVGSTEEVTIGELARLVKAMTGSTSPIVHVPYDRAYGRGIDDMPRRVPDIQKITNLIGFRPTRTIRDILLDVTAHTRQLMEPSLPEEPVPQLARAL